MLYWVSHVIPPHSRHYHKSHPSPSDALSTDPQRDRKEMFLVIRKNLALWERRCSYAVNIRDIKLFCQNLFNVEVFSTLAKPW